MRVISIIILIWGFCQSAIFAQFEDDFSDGDFTNNPIWDGEVAKFIVSPEMQLRLLAPAESADAHLSLSSQAIENASWEFFVRLNFNPSATNYARVYLTSNNPDLTGALNGYFVYIGGTQDKISLFRQTETVRTEIITGVSGSVNMNDVQVKIRVTRDNIGNWTLERDTALTDVFLTEGTVLDNTHFQSQFFGVYCDYTATRSDKFYFDDFVVTGDPYIDTEPPVFQQLEVLSSNELRLTFNEELSENSANISSFIVNNGIGLPQTAVLNPMNQAQISLTFEEDFTDGTNYVLSVSNISDLAGNMMTNFSEPFYYFVISIPIFGEIRINEVMANESPSVGQPLTEYVELFNTTNKTFDLAGYRICNDNACGTIQNGTIQPNSYLLITPTSGLPFFPGINAINATSFPALKNGGDEVILRNPSQTEIIDQMHYDLTTYQDPSKNSGGYSLELINPYALCLGAGNWRATDSPIGGTPGGSNSVFDNSPDSTPPALISAVMNNPFTLVLTFNELLNQNELVNMDFEMDANFEIDIISVSGVISATVTLVFENPLTPNVIYSFIINNLSDCEGNSTDISGEFVLADDAEAGDLIINEILFNPVTGGSDYVELYNNSQKYLNLQNWNMANRSNDNPANLRIISSQTLILAPGSYLVLTADSAQVKQTYPNHGFGRFQYCALPTYANSNGNVLLINSLDSIVDEVNYEEKWHFRLIDDKKGKSLERINTNVASNDPDNWQTASEAMNWGTPGLQNSQYLNPQAQGQFTVEPKVISPDNDGFDDFALFTYELPENTMVGTLKIYDENGRPVREIFLNELLAQTGFVKWDGLDNNGMKCRMGRYLVLLEVFGATTGTTAVFKQMVVLAGKV